MLNAELTTFKVSVVVHDFKIIHLLLCRYTLKVAATIECRKSKHVRQSLSNMVDEEAGGFGMLRECTLTKIKL